MTAARVPGTTKLADVVGRQTPAALVSFICVGGGAAIAFVVLSATLVTLAPGIAPWLVNGACHVALVLPVYALHRRFSFHSSAPHRQALPRYVAVQALSVGLVALFSMLVYRLLLVEPVIAASLVTALTSGVSFILLKAWVFARRHPRAAVLPLAGL